MTDERSPMDEVMERLNNYRPFPDYKQMIEQFAELRRVCPRFDPERPDPTNGDRIVMEWGEDALAYFTFPRDAEVEKRQAEALQWTECHLRLDAYPKDWLKKVLNRFDTCAFHLREHMEMLGTVFRDSDYEPSEDDEYLLGHVFHNVLFGIQLYNLCKDSLVRSENAEGGHSYRVILGTLDYLSLSLHTLHTTWDLIQHEKAIFAGWSVLHGAIKGHEAVHGTAEQKSQRWAKYQEAYDRLRRDKPTLSKRRCYELVGKQFGVSAKTVQRHVKS